MPVAFEVARRLGAPLDVIVVRKLGVPIQPELAMGAVGEGGVLVLNQDVLTLTGVDQAKLAAVEQRERTEVEQRAARFRSGRPTSAGICPGKAWRSTPVGAAGPARWRGQREERSSMVQRLPWSAVFSSSRSQ